MTAEHYAYLALMFFTGFAAFPAIMRLCRFAEAERNRLLWNWLYRIEVIRPMEKLHAKRRAEGYPIPDAAEMSLWRYYDFADNFREWADWIYEYGCPHEEAADRLISIARKLGIWEEWVGERD